MLVIYFEMVDGSVYLVGDEGPLTSLIGLMESNLGLENKLGWYPIF